MIRSSSSCALSLSFCCEEKKLKEADPVSTLHITCFLLCMLFPCGRIEQEKPKIRTIPHKKPAADASKIQEYTQTHTLLLWMWRERLLTIN
jgi:hypothetical protein